jgi:hypothetical protein
MNVSITSMIKIKIKMAVWNQVSRVLQNCNVVVLQPINDQEVTQTVCIRVVS